jgi:polyferredoxin
MTIRTVRNLRRISQIVFFAVFFWLILKTTFEVSFTPNSTEAIRLPYPVSIALEFDPLVALMTLLSSGTVYKGLLWSLVILIPTIFLGRFFCGWVCPLGSLNHWTSEFTSERNFRKGPRRIESNRYKGYQRIKYYVFFILVGAAFAGSLQAGLLDPLPLLARSLGTFLLPSIHSVADGVLGVCKDTGWPPLMNGAQSVYDAFAVVFLPFRQAHFNTILSVGILFLLIVALNRVITRFWCRGICPLGAMLGLFSRFSLFGLQKDQATCNHCNLCLVNCQGADNPDVGEKWRQAECHLCLNCQASCPQDSLSFKFFPNHTPTKENPAPTQKIDVTRRTVITSVAAGLGTWALFRAGADFEVNANPLTIRPPGSLAEPQFIEKCIRCGQCMRVCPNNALHPTLLEAGAEAMWTPILIAKIGYCEPTCTLCGQVCPTGAIAELTITQKVGDKSTPANRIGTAFIDRGRCLPWAMATPCIVCEEWCPTSPKAVYLKEETVFNSVGLPVLVKQPYIDAHQCTGCGACEFACPVTDKKAIRISSVGESRSERNQILLERKR